MIESIKTIELLAIFFVPGFLVLCLKRILRPNQYINNIDNTWICFAYSLFITGAAIYMKPGVLDLLEEDKLGEFIANISGPEFIVFLLTIFIVVLNIKLNLGYLIMCCLRLDPPTPHSTAWVSCFSKAQKGYIIVHLLDGKKIYGYFGENSLASSDIGYPDLYIEARYKYSKSEGWKDCSQISGVYIAKEQISYIEFMKPGKGNSEDEAE